MNPGNPPMHFEYDPREYEVVHKVHICDFHKENPTDNWVGCSCYGSFTLVRKNFSEIKEQSVTS